MNPYNTDNICKNNCKTCFHNTIPPEGKGIYCKELKINIRPRNIEKHNNCGNWKDDNLGYVNRR